MGRSEKTPLQTWTLVIQHPKAPSGFGYPKVFARLFSCLFRAGNRWVHFFRRVVRPGVCPDGRFGQRKAKFPVGTPQPLAAQDALVLVGAGHYHRHRRRHRADGVRGRQHARCAGGHQTARGDEYHHPRRETSGKRRHDAAARRRLRPDLQRLRPFRYDRCHHPARADAHLRRGNPLPGPQTQWPTRCHLTRLRGNQSAGFGLRPLPDAGRQ